MGSFTRRVGDETVVISGGSAHLFQAHPDRRTALRLGGLAAGAVVLSVPLAHAASAASGTGPAPATAPGAVQELDGSILIASRTLLTLTWDPPADGAEVTDYEIRQLATADQAFEDGSPIPFEGGTTTGYQAMFPAVLRQAYFFAVRALADAVPGPASVVQVFANGISNAGTT